MLMANMYALLIAHAQCIARVCVRANASHLCTISDLHSSWHVPCTVVFQSVYYDVKYQFYEPSHGTRVSLHRKIASVHPWVCPALGIL